MMERKNLLIAGGDKRMQYAGDYLSAIFNVSCTGETEEEPDAVLLPAVSADSMGEAEMAELLERMKPDGIVLSGHEKGLVRRLCNERRIRYVNYMELPELALANAVPTAEAAIKLAIEVTERTIWQSRIFVAGFGRIGAVLTDRLIALGAKVTAGARKEYDRTRIKTAGAEPAELPPDKTCLSETDIIFNTVPAEIFGREQLSGLGKECVYIELASAPGGAKEENVCASGCKYVRAAGLPPHVTG